ncbi:Na+/H+ antiporter subunit E [Pseudonocardia oroxyli]|uniref:Multisubunit sodium/proton antiporter, MrpE subunit n=1 Tax=Pseudonocardia oroxyli TaxID=366584 RepID=A0A1G7KLH6_PSEOR|nr:Na+/H+ antiporter subunit E [Pseudonocardia oroxyli]SDF38006.1 multisubunit sodium/proton antiporter, MrpE subunit [Pseudonocardia oroxyli]
MKRWPQILWLTVVWVLLWGYVTPTIVVGGLVVALLVTVLFPLPVLNRLPFRPWPLLRLGAFLVADLFRSGWDVAVETLRYGPKSRAGIVAVPLLTDSERVITLIAGAAALTPGSFVLQIDRAGCVLYVYALGLRSAADAEQTRAHMRRLQERVVSAVGVDGVTPTDGRSPAEAT